MPDGGTIWTSADKLEISEDDPLPLEAGSYVKIVVRDEGVGIPWSMLSRVFDPYFSTKDAGHGLGPSISHSIIQKHGGQIGVTSRPGEGATFTLYLPAAGEEAVEVNESAVGSDTSFDIVITDLTIQEGRAARRRSADYSRSTPRQESWSRADTPTTS